MVTIAIRVKPGASRTRVGGAYHGPYGPALVIAVSAPPVDGRATEAALRALARAIGVRPGALRLKAGAASRDKLVLLDDAPADLPARIEALRGNGS
jgi:uncharacterized protein YggU (UPF0235/DUF167 family)